MSDETTIGIDIQARVYAIPDEHGEFEIAATEKVRAPEGIDATISLIEQADGWRFGVVANLPAESLSTPLSALSDPLPSRGAALVAAYQDLTNWASNQVINEPLGASKKHRKLAGQLFAWSKAQQESLGMASSTPEAPAAEAVPSVPPLPSEDLQTTAISDGPLVDLGPGLTFDAPVITRTDVAASLVPLADLYESPLNPRQYYPEAKMQELAASMRSSGFRPWQPIVARIKDDKLWIAAGHRRSRAAAMAGLTEVWCVSREMSDDEFADILNFDNGGRDDVHPLHEAAGWRAWMEQTGKGVLDIAARIGQSKEYVYQRLKYAALIPTAAKAFLDGEYLTAGHAIEIARCDTAGQARALQFCVPPEWDSERHVSVRELRAWIKKNLHATLDVAPFALDAADLVPAAGSCTACPFRLGNMPDFDATVDLPNVCTHPECYEAKYDAQTAVDRAKRLAEAHAPEPWKAPLAPPAPPAEPKPKKAKPTKEEKEAQAERERLAVEELRREQERADQERKEREEKLESEKKTRCKILRAILDKVKWPPRREEVESLLGDLDLPGELEEFLVAEGFEETGRGFTDLSKASDQRIAALLVIVDVSNDFDDWAFGHGAEKLNASAKRYGVDVARLRAAAEGGTRKEVVKKLPVMGAPAKKAMPAKAPAMTPPIAVRIVPAKPAPKPAPAKKAPAKKAAPVKSAKKAKGKK